MKKILVLLCISSLVYSLSSAQTTGDKNVTPKFKNETSISKFLDEPPFNLEGNRSLSFNLDGPVFLKSIGIGAQRKINNKLFEVELRKGFGRMENFQTEIFTISMFNNGRLVTIDTAKYNFGTKIGINKISRYGSMTGWMYGANLLYDNSNLYYDAGNGFGPRIAVKNSLNRISIAPNVGFRFMFSRKIGMAYQHGFAIRYRMIGDSGIATDDLSKSRKLGFDLVIGNLNLTYLL